MNIVLGVSGGIAAYKAVLLLRLLVEEGHDVHVVPTKDALRFVGLPTWESLSKNTVTTSVHEDVPEVRHVALGQQADLVIVAPATANTLAKMASGLADDLLGTTLLATKAPVLVAPAMHTEMWEHPATQHSMNVLRDRGVVVVGPESGRLTGTDTGPGRMSEPETIAEEARRVLSSPLGDGTHVLVTAGGTREPIDPVRFIGNRSSGRQGVAVARAAAERGCRVTLIAANIEASVLHTARHPLITVEHVGSTTELQEVTVAHASKHDIIVMAAAVSDYRVAEVSEGKIRKEDGEGTVHLTLVENPDILRGLAQTRREGQIIIGFAAETAESLEELHERGRAKGQRKGVDVIAVNLVGWHEGFETDANTLHLIDHRGEVIASPSGTKLDTARALMDEALRLFEANTGT